MENKTHKNRCPHCGGIQIKKTGTAVRILTTLLIPAGILLGLVIGAIGALILLGMLSGTKDSETLGTIALGILFMLSLPAQLGVGGGMLRKLILWRRQNRSKHPLYRCRECSGEFR